MIGRILLCFLILAHLSFTSSLVALGNKTLTKKSSKRRSAQTARKKRLGNRKRKPLAATAKPKAAAVSVPVDVAASDAVADVVPIKKHYVTSQGKTLHLKIKAPQPLHTAYTSFAGTQYTFHPIPSHERYYECFIPVDCQQQPGSYNVIIKTENNAQEKKSIGCSLRVEPFPFQRQRGFKLSKKKRHLLKRAGIGSGDSSLILNYKSPYPDTKLWNGPFIEPINVQGVTAPFGEIRTSKKYGLRHHLGIDLVDAPRSPIHAANDGVLAARTHTPMGGNVVAIDHGRGIFTIYCHLDSFASGLTVGSRISKGQRIGRIGMTGYASGYHLHLEMRIKDTRGKKSTAVDFMEWTTAIY